MANVRGRENEIRTLIKNGDEKYTMAFGMMMSFYRYTDFMDKSNHCQIINLIYRPVRRYKLKFISFLANVDENTLRRNRRKYIACFDFCLVEAESALSGKNASLAKIYQAAAYGTAAHNEAAYSDAARKETSAHKEAAHKEAATDKKK